MRPSNNEHGAMQVPIGPITRARAKKLQSELNGFIQSFWTQVDANKAKDDLEAHAKPVHLIGILPEP